jgi:alpha-glucuronidase
MAKVKEPRTGRKGGPISKIKKDRLKEEILTIIEEGKLSSFNKLGYARDNQVSRATIERLLEDIGSEIPQENKEIIKVDIISLYNRMKKRILYWWDKCENATEDEQSFFLEQKVIKELRETMKDFRETLTALGVLDKVADKIDLTADITHKQVIINYNINGNPRDRL